MRWERKQGHLIQDLWATPKDSAAPCPAQSSNFWEESVLWRLSEELSPLKRGQVMLPWGWLSCGDVQEKKPGEVW